MYQVIEDEEGRWEVAVCEYVCERCGREILTEEEYLPLEKIRLEAVETAVLCKYCARAVVEEMLEVAM